MHDHFFVFPIKTGNSWVYHGVPNTAFLFIFEVIRIPLVHVFAPRQFPHNPTRRHGIQCTSWKETGRGTPWDPKPPSFPARPLPHWICELLQDERPVSGVQGRPLPFASSLRASGMVSCHVCRILLWHGSR